MQKITRILFPVIVIAFGIILIVVGVQNYRQKDLYDASVMGVITDIEEEWTGGEDNSVSYTVYVDYEVNGREFTHMHYPYYSGSMRIGDEIEVLYQSAHPELIAEPNTGGHALIILFGGIGLLLLAVFMILKALIRR